MGWITPAIQSLQQRVAPHFEFICHFDPSSKHLFNVIKTTPSDAESREEQDGSKQKFVGGMMSKLWPDLHQGVMKNTEENENERLLKKAIFPASFDDWIHQNGNLMVSK